MSRYGSCAACSRAFRSKAARELAERYKIVHDDLRASYTVSYSNTPAATKVERHRQDAADFRAGKT